MAKQCPLLKFDSRIIRLFQLLIALSISDTVLIAFFVVSSICVTVSEKEPQWFIFVFSKVLWPLGNIYITVSVLLVVAASTERYLAICRPLQYKPKAVFFIMLVFATSVSVNIGRWGCNEITKLLFTLYYFLNGTIPASFPVYFRLFNMSLLKFKFKLIKV